jgi:tRNA(Leu) C34 or U34 (ribose-2'-O)-methylase TrmL
MGRELILTDPYDPSTVRATMGAIFRQRFVRTTVTEFRRWKRDSLYRLVGTSPSATTDYHMVSYDTPTILFMGEERKGLPPELQSLCDMMVSIPMIGEDNSLNLAVATSVMLYEMFNQRRDRAGSGASGVLEKERTLGRCNGGHLSKRCLPLHLPMFALYNFYSIHLRKSHL